jgi:hypothetical protein
MPLASQQPSRPPRPPRRLRHVRSGGFFRLDVFEVRANDDVAAAWLEPAADGDAIRLRTGDGGDWTISRVLPGWSYFAASNAADGRDATFEAAWIRSGGRLQLRRSGRTLRLKPHWMRWRLVEGRTVLADFSRPVRGGPLEFKVSAGFAESDDMELALPFALWMATTFEQNTNIPSK